MKKHVSFLLSLAVGSLLMFGMSPNLFCADVQQSPEIQDILQSYVDQKEIAGAIVVIADKDQTLSQTIVGYADLESNKEMTGDSFFWIASMTKPFTAVAVMMLVEEGKINLDDPVEKYIPALEKWMVQTYSSDHCLLLEKPKRKVTVRHLLTHSAGLSFIPEIETVVSAIDILPLERASLSSVTGPLVYHPGESYRYSNQGIDIAGRVVEIAAGIPYQDFLQQRIFDPLEMHDTTFWPNEQQLARLAKSYDLAKKPIKEVPISLLSYPLSDRNRRYPNPGGGLFSSADDLVRFGQMLVNRGTFQGKQFLTSESIEEMRKDQTGETKAHYGLCFGTFDTFFGHGGAYGTQILVSPEQNTVILYLIQAVNGKVGTVWEEVRKKSLELK